MGSHCNDFYHTWMLILESQEHVMHPLPCSHGVLLTNPFWHPLLSWLCFPTCPLCIIQSEEAQGICHLPGPCHRFPASPFPPCSAPTPLLTTLLFPQERFVDLYGNDAAAEVRKGQETFNKWLLTGATVAGVLLLGSLLSRK